MKRWWAWVFGGIVVVAAVVRLSMGGSSLSEQARPGKAPVQPAPTPPASFNLAAEARRRLFDDRLPPPPPGAPLAAWDQYRTELKDIRAGKDPLRAARSQIASALSNELFNQRLQQRLDSAVAQLPSAEKGYQELQARQEELQNMRADTQALIDKLRLESKAYKEDARSRMIQGGINPDQPPPPLFPKPNLGPPLLDENGKPVKELIQNPPK